MVDIHVEDTHTAGVCAGGCRAVVLLWCVLKVILVRSSYLFHVYTHTRQRGDSWISGIEKLPVLEKIMSLQKN